MAVWLYDCVAVWLCVLTRIQLWFYWSNFNATLCISLCPDLCLTISTAIAGFNLLCLPGSGQPADCKSVHFYWDRSCLFVMAPPIILDFHQPVSLWLARNIAFHIIPSGLALFTGPVQLRIEAGSIWFSGVAFKCATLDSG